MVQKPIPAVIIAQMYIQEIEWSSQVRTSEIHDVEDVEKSVKLDYTRVSMRLLSLKLYKHVKFPLRVLKLPHRFLNKFPCVVSDLMFQKTKYTSYKEDNKAS